ncbi:phosphatidylinositol glycan anchor biosynthesis class U [Lycorma delicatula]|uniref:phosphatidylinositol glycan anchor biosynthesis class U n=1 Tax=Lycorma delicatula TaxID=130591 RepID=UPI003F511797
MENLLILEYIVAAIIRLWLSISDYKGIITDRVEISTPLNSWKRVTEGVALYNEGTDPYMGDMLHETPVGLIIYNWMLQNLGDNIMFAFIICDLITAQLLFSTAKHFICYLLSRQEKEKDNYAKVSPQLLVSPDDVQMGPVFVASAYLFNPYIVLSCAAQTTTVFANLFLAMTFYSMLKGNVVLCTIALALSAQQSLYTIILLVPVCMYIAQNKKSKLFHMTMTCLCFIVVLSALVCCSYYITNSWDFLYSTYGFILTVPDLRPNIGLFWYFFTEMFEHFRVLFLCAFQMNASILYLGPLAFRLHAEPMLLATSLTTLIAIFKSYPSIGDVGFYLALLPMWKHLFHYMQQGFIVSCFFIITLVLGPTFWHLWIYNRSANANFYFGVTLAFATAQIFLVTDLLFAYIKREYALVHGLPRTIDGKEAKLVLESAGFD